MNFSPGRISNELLANAATRRLLIGWLPIIAVGVLIFWLSGGVPPTAWRLLIQILSSWSVLQVSLGGGILFFFLIVLVQSLMILVAWMLLAFAIWREASVVSMLWQQRHDIHLQAHQAASLATTGSQGVQVMPDDVVIKQPEDDVLEPSMNTGIQIIPTQDSEQDSPFDVNQAVFELFPEPDEPEEDDITYGVPRFKEEETVFVYGNPLEGELPDVFEYDKDLKRGIQNMFDEQKRNKNLDDDKNKQISQEEKL